MLRILLTLLSVLLLVPLALTAQGGDSAAPIAKSIQSKHQKADEQAKLLKDLSKKEGKLATRIESIEANVKSLQSKVRSQEQKLQEIKTSETKAQAEYLTLEKEQERTVTELEGLLKTIWPIHIKNVQGRFQGVESWDMLDRRFNWLANIYGATRAKLEEVKTNARFLAENLEKQRQLEQDAEKQLAKINSSKDKLLQDKLSLRATLSDVRKEKQSAESELQGILSAIEDLRYQLKTQKTKHFSFYKRSLPWPVGGQVVNDFNLGVDPPRRGLEFSTRVKDQVRSVFWGKVVHNDTLRGFGKVIIIYHGDNYYSLYAYLEDSYVTSGQEVEKDEPIGTAGFYPKVDGPGLYFELRFHQKPINPKNWLISQQ